MLKVAIYDDERIIQEGLKQVIPWGDYRFNAVYTTKDGVEALSLIQQHQPKLVIAGIRIPRENGADLLNDIAHLDYNVTILPSYGDFEYTKAGIQHHVPDYLLKLVDHAQLEIILERLIRTLLEQQSQNGRSLASYHDTFQPLLKVEYNDYYANQIMDRIKQSCQTRVTVPDLIQHIGVSESYAMRTFRGHVGITVIDYLNCYRILQPLQLLDRHYRHYEITDKIGFSEYKMFSYHFKRYLQVSPSDYCRQAK